MRQASSRQAIISANHVIILYMPYQEVKSLDIKVLDPLTVEGIRSYADKVVHIIYGLGENITVIEISGGGSSGARTAQNRPEVLVFRQTDMDG